MSAHVERYSGQPNPGARLPLPIAQARLAAPALRVDLGQCSCGEPADAIVRPLFRREEQRVCARCAHSRGISDVLDRRQLAMLGSSFQLEEAMLLLGWRGSPNQLSHILHRMGLQSWKTREGGRWVHLYGWKPQP